MRDNHYKIRNLTIGIFLILLFCAMLLKADEEILTLESAIQMALSRNERAMAADEQVAAAESRVTKARAFFLPSLNITGTYTRRPNEVIRSVGGQQTVVQKYNALAGLMQLNLTIFDSHSLPTLLQANSERRAENYTASESKRQLAFEVSNAFLTTLSLDQVLEASKHRFDYAKQALEAARARYAAGLVSVNDVTRAELEYATAEMGITQVKGQLETTYLQLGYLLVETEILQKKLKVPEFLLQAAANNPAAMDQLVSEAQDRRLDLGSLRWHAKAQHALVIEPVLKWLPSLAFIGQRRYTNEPGLTGRTWNWNLGLTATWSIFDGFTRNADYKESKALAVLADLDVKSAMRRVELDVRDALVSLTNQQASLKQAAVAYDVAKRNAAQIAELYRQGLATVLQVADANVSLFEAEVELVRQRYGLAISYLNLEAALGLDPFGKEPTL
jgi:outer membrane protein TolC